MFQKVIIKTKKKKKKTPAWIHVLYISSSFILCFTSAQCNRHGQYQADMRIHTKRALAYRVRVDINCA